MSERGSFCTEYVYCQKCFAAIKPILLSSDRGFRSVVIPHWNSLTNPSEREIPIIAGKISGSYAGEELDYFRDFGALYHKISAVICHPLRIAVLAEAGEEIITIAVAA